MISSKFLLLFGLLFLFFVFLQTPVAGLAQTSYNDNLGRLNNNGLSLTTVGRYSEALLYYNAALRIDPNISELLNNGLSLTTVGRYSEALLYYNAALRIDPNNAVVLLAKGANFLALGMNTQAIQQFEEAIQQFEEVLQLDYNDKVIQYLDNNGIVRTIDFSEVLDGIALAGKGATFLALGMNTQAIQQFEEVLQLDYNVLGINLNNNYYSIASTGIGSALANLGYYQEALPYYNAALRLDPNNDVLLNNIGAALANLGDYQEALPYYNAALRINPTNIYALYNIGVALATLGDYQEAIRYYDQVLTRSPNNVDVLTYKGDALAKLGRTDEAIENYDRAIELLQFSQSVPQFSQSSSYQHLVSTEVSIYTSTLDNEDLNIRYVQISNSEIQLIKRSIENARDSIEEENPPDYDSAIRYYDTVLRIDPSNGCAYYGKYEVYTNLDRETEANTIIEIIRNQQLNVDCPDPASTPNAQTQNPNLLGTLTGMFASVIP